MLGPLITMHELFLHARLNSAASPSPRIIETMVDPDLVLSNFVMSILLNFLTLTKISFMGV
jgi:hypothetical protein